MTFHEVAGVAAGLVSLAAYPQYIRDVIRGETHPQRVTWMIYVALSLVAIFSQKDLGASWSLGLSIAQLIGTGTILALSVRSGVGGSSTIDRLCLGFALVAIIFQFALHQSLLAILLVIATDIVGTTPTIIKSWRDPASETLSAWVLDSIAGGLGLIAVGRPQPNLLAFPAALLIENAVVAVSLLASPKRHHTSS